MENDERQKRQPTTAANNYDEQQQPKTATNNHSFSEMVAG
jgi:hypothetical protein